MNFKRFNVASAITLGLLILFGALALLDGLSPVYAENAPDAIAEVVVGNAPLRANISGTWTHNGVEDEWEQGTPDNAANGAPRHCASGPEGCWVTDLDDSYNSNADESLYSPVITVPVTATLPVSVTWRQAWYIEDAYYDRAYADYRCNGGAWTNLWQHYSGSQTGSDAAESWQIAPGAHQIFLSFGQYNHQTDIVLPVARPNLPQAVIIAERHRAAEYLPRQAKGEFGEHWGVLCHWLFATSQPRSVEDRLPMRISQTGKSISDIAQIRAAAR